MSTQETELAAKHGSHDDSEYAAFLARVNTRFQTNVANGLRPVFQTDAADLWTAYLKSFTDPAERQHHNCSACRHFINHFGGLVTIEADGTRDSAIWNADDAPPIYKPAVAVMRQVAMRAKIVGPFLSSDSVLGTPVTGAWQHLSVTPPPVMRYKGTALTAGQAMAAKREDFKTVWRALDEFPLAVLEQALTLLRSEALYRSEKVLGAAEWLHGVLGERERAPGHLKAPIVWRAVAIAPDGFCHPRSSMIGTLLEDILSGMEFADVARRFADKMRPSNYQRAQAAPSAGAIIAAEKLVEKMGLAPALPRRYARLAELPTLWKPVEEKVQHVEGATVFGHIRPKQAEAETPVALRMPATTMTWEKFQRTVLPTATAIEALVPAESDRFMALVTALNADAPPILRWDREEARNPVSWYYASGIDAEIKKRVVNAGGRYADVDIRASLIWNNRNDLDLHVITPAGDHVYFADKRANCGGWLDVDMNVRGETTAPIENTRWERGHARNGMYRVYVENYRFHEHSHQATPFRVELEVNGDVFHFDGCTPAGCNHGLSRVEVATINYLQGARIVTDLRKATEGPSAWSVQPDAFVPVTGVVLSPNLWGEKPMTDAGKHVFFTLAGCKDVGKGVGRGFFTETLRGELHAVRSTLEAYNASATIAGAEEADACGLGVSSDAPMDLVLRVKSAIGTNLYKLDRWD